MPADKGGFVFRVASQGASCDHPGCLAVAAPPQSCKECQGHPTVCPHTLVNAWGPGPFGRVSENMPERPHKTQPVDHTGCA